VLGSVGRARRRPRGDLVAGALGALLALGCARSPLDVGENGSGYAASGGVAGRGGSPAFGGAGRTGSGGAGGTGGGAGTGGSVGGAGAAGVSGSSGIGGSAGVSSGSAGTSAGGAGAGGAPNVMTFQLFGAPLAFAPTVGGFGLNVVLAAGDPQKLNLYVRPALGSTWQPWTGAVRYPAIDVAEWTLEGLAPGTEYQYLLTGFDADVERTLYLGTVITQRQPGASFSAALITDTHIHPRDLPVGDKSLEGPMEQTLGLVAPEIAAIKPDFVLNLGDILDFHSFGFNDPPPDPLYTRLGYVNYRRVLGDTLGHGAHFGVIGNWDGENGCNTEEEIQRSLTQRLLYQPNPGPETYPEGGSVNQDYYAFTWGDALFVVLNVMTYTPSCHLLDTFPGLPDDWTLGAAQLDWLRETLENATSKWRFTFVHHTVGGQAGNPVDSAYGRGGGQAAYVGEQALIHQLLLDHGVQIFFYAHDHVFTDMVVDGVHYTLPGSAGAPWKFTTEETGYTEYWEDSGFARLDVGPDAVKVSFVALGGAVLDEINLP
jgi:hypothetical protein